METSLVDSSPPIPDSSLASSFLCCPPHFVRSSSSHRLSNPRHPRSWPMLLPLRNGDLCIRRICPFHVAFLQNTTNAHSPVPFIHRVVFTDCGCSQCGCSQCTHCAYGCKRYGQCGQCGQCG